MIYLPECQSTNDIAIAMLNKHLIDDGTIVITDCQTAGRGQMGTQWHTIPGENLTFSYVKVWEHLDVNDQFQISAAVALALVEAINSQTGLKIDIKWPNDLYYYSKKVGGILIQNAVSASFIDYSVIGIGLNINQQHFEHLPNATSLAIECNQLFAKNEILKAVKSSLTYHLAQVPSATLMQRYNQALLYTNMTRYYTLPNGDTIIGSIAGVASDGKLIVQTTEGERLFGLKEIIF